MEGLGGPVLIGSVDFAARQLDPDFEALAGVTHGGAARPAWFLRRAQPRHVAPGPGLEGLENPGDLGALAAGQPDDARHGHVDLRVRPEQADGGADAGPVGNDQFRYFDGPRQARRVHRPGAAKGDQGIIARVAAALYGNHPHGAFHVAVGHRVDAPRGFLHGKAQGSGDVLLDALGGGNRVERHGAAVEILRIEIAEHQIGVGDGRTPAACAIAHGSRVGAGALGADRDQAHVGTRDGAAAGPDLQQLHRRDVEGQPAALLVLDGVDLEGGDDRRLAVVDGAELGGGAAHVEGHDVVEAFVPADDGTHQDTRRRTRFDDADWIVAGQLGGHQPAVRLHDEQIGREAARLQGTLQLTEIVPDEGLDVGVGDRRRGALVFAEFGRHLRGDGNLEFREGAPNAVTHRLLVGVVGIGVKEHDGDRFVVPGPQALDRRLDVGTVDGGQHLAVRRHSLADLEDIGALDEGDGLFEIEIVGVVALLPGDEQDVAEPLGCHQCRTVALAFEDGVGGHGGGVQGALDLPGLDIQLREHGVDAGEHGVGRFARRARHLGETHIPGGGVVQHEIRERAADVEGDADHIPIILVPPRRHDSRLVVFPSSQYCIQVHTKGMEPPGSSGKGAAVRSGFRYTGATAKSSFPSGTWSNLKSGIVRGGMSGGNSRTHGRSHSNNLLRRFNAGT